MSNKINVLPHIIIIRFFYVDKKHIIFDRKSLKLCLHFGQCYNRLNVCEDLIMS